MFGRKKQGNTPAPAESKTYQEVRMEDWLDVVEASKTRSHTSFKGFFGKKNSEEYTAIENSLREIVNQMDYPLSSDVGDNFALLRTLMRAYAKLIRACETYGKKDGGTSSSGRERKEMAEAICNNAKGDLAAVMSFYEQIRQGGISPGAQANMTWTEVLSEGREKKVDLAEVDELVKPAGLPKPVVHGAQENALQPEKALSKSTLYNHDMEDWLKALESSEPKKRFYERGIFAKQTATEYTAVKDSLRLVLQCTKATFSMDISENLEMVKRGSEAYFKLRSACWNYLSLKEIQDLKEDDDSVLKLRKNMVTTILKLAEQDFSAAQQCYIDIYQGKMTGRQQAALTWQEIIHNGREATIEVDDLHDDNKYQALGGKSKSGENASRLLDEGVFTKEQRVSTQAAFSWFFGAANCKRNEDQSKYGRDTSITNRNVATSRIAALLGLSGIVEESKTVNVKDRKTGNVYRGNLMSVAKGEQSKSVEESIRKDTAGIDQLEERMKAVSGMFSPSLQKELCSLQVLDYLCGQGDRHHQNYFMEKGADGKYAHVHGIDNDMSFASGVKGDNEELERFGNLLTKGRLVIGKNDELTIPYMDRSLAINILYLSRDTVRFVLQDLLESEYIEKTLKRLELLQEAIRKEGLDSPRFLKNEEDWNEATAISMMKKSSMWKRKDNYSGLEKGGYQIYGESTYFGEMMMQAMAYNPDEKSFFDGIQ